METDPKALRREVRKLRKQLADLSAAVTVHLELMDRLMREPGTVERGRLIARACNALDVENDRARYFALGVDYRTDAKKPKAGG